MNHKCGRTWTSLQEWHLIILFLQTSRFSFPFLLDNQNGTWPSRRASKTPNGEVLILTNHVVKSRVFSFFLCCL